jgi:Protein of unknown function (DUF2380)
MKLKRLIPTAAFITLMAARLGAAEPIVKIAVFDFELQDYSAAEAHTPDAIDAKYLTEATDQTRRLLTQDPHYRLIDATSTNAPEAKNHTLRDCNGCEATIARELGADQSLIGIVSRISRTEYTIKIQIRDAKTAALIAEQTTPLQMGANYAWPRGATHLVKDHLLSTHAK